MNSNVCPDADDTWNESHVPYLGQSKHVATWELTIKVAVYVTIIIASLVGNMAVILVVWRNQHMRTATNYFFVNLAVCDLMVTSSCTWVHLITDLTDDWFLGRYFCKFNSFAQVTSLVASILTLTIVSCDRFFGIVFAMKARVTERRTTVFIVLVWICAVLVSCPILVYRQQSSRQWLDHTEVWCGDDEWPKIRTYVEETASCITQRPSRLVYYTLVSTVLYFIPIAVMSVTYGLIIWKLWSSNKPGEIIPSDITRQEQIRKRVVVMLVTLLTVFAVCWTPLQVAMLYVVSHHESDKALPEALFFSANLMAFSNSAFNPIIYSLFNANFRRGLKDMFCRQPATSGNTSMAIAARCEVSMATRSMFGRSLLVTKTTTTEFPDLVIDHEESHVSK